MLAKHKFFLEVKHRTEYSPKIFKYSILALEMNRTNEVETERNCFTNFLSRTLFQNWNNPNWLRKSVSWIYKSISKTNKPFALLSISYLIHISNCSIWNYSVPSLNSSSTKPQITFYTHTIQNAQVNSWNFSKPLFASSLTNFGGCA